MIYVSTGGFSGRTADTVSVELSNAGVNGIELSGGSYSATLLGDLRQLGQNIRFQIHNYFPPPANPFVLNLASLDAEIAEKSIAHVEQALRWCVALDADRYSFHAGFLLDPRVDELGRRIPNRSLFDRKECIDVFVSRVSRLSALAERAGVTLMIENNVLSAKNAAEFPSNPLLMCDPRECRAIMDLMPDNVGLLIDVAHLKVSANSLDFAASKMFELCDDRITAYHLSDNNGLEDSNQTFNEHAWFWRHLKPDADYFSVEVYGCAPARLSQQVGIVRSQLQAMRHAV